MLCLHMTWMTTKYFFSRKIFDTQNGQTRSKFCQNPEMAKIWPFVTKIWPFFGQNWQLRRFLAFNSQRPLWIFLIFGMEVVLMVFFKRIISFMSGKFKDVQNLAIFDQILAFLWVFSLYLPKIVADLSSFLTSLNFDSFRRTNHTVSCLTLVFRLK